ncbi:flavoprotein [Thermocatellispora tengchongensis]|uniref:flavoprotein n=1 Tax=Thermocatellispora tengchongensis TaxID=1073253 RepID=UPI00362BF722
MELAQWASLFVVLPASANTIGMAANGLAPNLLTATIMAAPPGVVFFPNMNQSMWSNPALKRNLAALQKDGHVVVRPPIRKALEVGTGEMVDAPVLPTPEEICVALRSLVAARTAEADGERAGGAAAR